MDGVIISNTTLSRPQLASPSSNESGGLSGKPLRSLATQQLAKFFLLTQGKLPLIGVGGVEDTQSALEKIRAGASLIQLYSALVFKGPGLVAEILDGLSAALGSRSLADVRGTDAYQLAQN